MQKPLQPRLLPPDMYRRSKSVTTGRSSWLLITASFSRISSSASRRTRPRRGPARRRGLRVSRYPGALQSAVPVWRRRARQDTSDARLLETIHRPAGARIENDLVDRDRPNPDRAGQQPQHDAFHDPVSLKEQGNQRDVSGWQRQGGLRHVGRIHKRCPLSSDSRSSQGCNGYRSYGRTKNAGNQHRREKP